jgi:putative phosphoribosyl transferase
MGSSSHRPYLAHFANRRDAGQQLAERLALRRFDRPLVLALPRGGAPVGHEIAALLDIPLDVLLVRKLGAPGFPELGLGAVVDGPQPQRVLNQHVIDAVQPPPGYLEEEERRQLALIAQRKAQLRRGRPPEPVKDRTVLLVDDGIATGGTMRVALKALERAGAERCVVAVPVAPPSALEQLGIAEDDFECLLSPPGFQSVGHYYADFEQVSDEEVVALLDHAAQRLASHAATARADGEGSAHGARSGGAG